MITEARVNDCYKVFDPRQAACTRLLIGGR
jgi:hypothetical protein